MSKLDKIAADADSHDFAEEMAHGTWEDDTEDDPMVTTSLRLPKSLLDWVRERASEQHVRPSVLVRQWVEQRRDAGGGAAVEDLAVRVERLEQAVFSDKRAS
ncbi:MAG: hypothetical protein ACYC1D_15660 [Acidimicrobiales bacterium]